MNKIIDYKKCFAYNKEKKACNCLTGLYCKNNKKCNFYQHKDNVDLKQIYKDIKLYKQF